MTVVQLPPTRPDLDTLLDAAIKVGGEPDAFDFKELLDPRTDEHKIRLLRAIGAFGNTDAGGHLFIGISDDRRLVGISDEIADLYDQTPIQRMVNQHFAPAPTIQIRQHHRDGKRLVIVEIAPFREIPCIVTQTVRAGKESLQAGTFLFRNAAAESAVLTTELDMRKLCDAISKRRAQAIVELVQRGLVGLQGPMTSPATRFAGLRSLRERADTYWPSEKGSPQYIEVFFAPERDLNISGPELRRVFPATSVPREHGFPFHDVFGGPVETPMPWGWLGAIPFTETPDPSKELGYLWMLDRDGSFLYREGFWEDRTSVIPNGVGVYHVAGLLIMLVRFLDRLSRALKLADHSKFTIGMTLNNVQGRYLEDERTISHWRRPAIPVSRAEASLEEELGRIRTSRGEVVVNLLEEIVWRFRAEWPRQNLVQVVHDTHLHLGPAYAFPAEEQVAPV